MFTKFKNYSKIEPYATITTLELNQYEVYGAEHNNYGAQLLLCSAP